MLVWLSARLEGQGLVSNTPSGQSGNVSEFQTAVGQAGTDQYGFVSGGRRRATYSVRVEPR